MSLLLGNNDLAQELVRRLGLPETTFELNISMSLDGIATCKCSFYLTREDLEYVMDKKNEGTKERLLRKMDDG